MKTLEEFDFDHSPVNEDLVRNLHGGSFVEQPRNAIFVGGTGTGKSHLAIAIGASIVNQRSRVRVRHGARTGGAPMAHSARLTWSIDWKPNCAKERPAVSQTGSAASIW